MTEQAPLTGRYCVCVFGSSVAVGIAVLILAPSVGSAVMALLEPNGCRAALCERYPDRYCPGSKSMRKAALLVFIAAVLPQFATADIVRRNSVPKAYWGTWVHADAKCNDADKSMKLTLQAQAYVSSAMSCVVQYVSETPSAKGVTYAVGLQCSNPAGQVQKKTSANLIIRPGDANQIYVGPDFLNLKPYKRCSEGGPGASP
jgi:hypothetical protein